MQQSFRLTDIGCGSTWVQNSLQEYSRAVAWTAFSQGWKQPLPEHTVEAKCCC